MKTKHLRLFTLTLVACLCVALSVRAESGAAVPSDQDVDSAISEDPMDKPLDKFADKSTTVRKVPAAKEVKPPMLDSELRLAESFSAEKNPGRGALTYKNATANETVELGTESGHFGFGLVFRHATLPEEFL